MIELKEVEKRFGSFMLGKIDLSVEEGEYAFLLGPSGSGKTVLLELIAGIHRPDRGKILINGKDITSVPIEKRGIGYSCQDPMLFPFLNVEGNIAFGLKEKKRKKDEIKRKVEEVAEMLGISKLLSRDVVSLSGGEKQRVSLARALVTDPQILLLDEPLSKLDAKMAYNLGRELKRINAELGVTMVQVTHNQAEAQMLADRVGILNEGKILQVGTPDEIFYSPKNKFTADFVNMENIFEGEVKLVNGLAVFETEDFELVIPHLRSTEKESVTIGIRPEDIEFVDSVEFKPGSVNILQGRVIDSHPSGSALYRVYVEVGGTVFVVDVIRYKAKNIRVGDDVNLRLSPEAIRVIS